MTRPVSVLLVDDSSAFLAAARSFLSPHPTVAVIGTAASGEAGVEQARALTPDLVLMDLNMPGIGGLEATRRIKAAANPPHVVILTLHAAGEYRASSVKAGADGFVSKSCLAVDLLPIIEALGPRVSRKGEEAAPDGDAAREQAHG